MPKRNELPSVTLNKRAAALKKQAVDAPGRGRGVGEQLAILAPSETVRALRIAAAEQGTSMRALVLEALAKAGYPVPKDELRDRRR